MTGDWSRVRWFWLALLLAGNLAVARAVTAGNRNAQLRDLPGHDHLGMRPGEREPSAEFMAVVLGWLGPAARPSPR